MKLTMQGRLDPCFLLSYALLEKAVDGLLPRGIHPLNYQGFAFLNIVFSRILKMRPAGVSAFFGLTYWHIAREEMLKYAPFGLSTDPSGHWLKIAEVQRDESEWEERPAQIHMADWRYLKRTIPGEARLVRATLVMPIDYHWQIGRMERL